MRKFLSVLLAATMVLGVTACGTSGTANDNKQEETTTAESNASEETTLVYGSGDYTRINPAMDEHCEINVLLFNGLTAYDACRN